MATREPAAFHASSKAAVAIARGKWSTSGTACAAARGTRQRAIVRGPARRIDPTARPMRGAPPAKTHTATSAPKPFHASDTPGCAKKSCR